MITKKREAIKDFLILLVDKRLKYTQIEKKLGYQKGYTKVKVSRLKKQGFIEKKQRIWHFTNKGQRLYRTPSRLITSKEQQVNIHFHRIKAKILKKNLLKSNQDFLEKVEMIIQIKKPDYEISQLQNTKIYILKSLYGTEIRATTSHILIKIPKMVFESLDHCLKYSEQYFNDILPKLERYFGIVLDTRFINIVWTSQRHIEYINHHLALIHRKYDCMDIEVIDNKTGKRELYFDRSGKTINAETEAIKKGVDIAYNLEQFDRDLVEGYSMNQNRVSIEEMKGLLFSSIKLQQKTDQQLAMFIEQWQGHLEYIKGAAKILDIGRREVIRLKAKYSQRRLGEFL